MENEEATAAQLKAEVEKVEKQQTKLNELMKSLATDSGDARRAGPTSTVADGELVKLLNKVRCLWQQASMQSNKLKPKAAKAQANADNKAKEAKDNAAFKAVLSKAKTEVTVAENAVNAVTKTVTPIVASPP